MSRYTFEEAKRRYNRIFIPAIVAYSLLLSFGTSALKRHPEPSAWIGFAIAFVVMVPVCVILFILWRYTQETDEYSRTRQTEALALSGILTAGAGGMIGFLQVFEAIPSVPMATLMLLPAFLALYGLILHLRGSGDCR